MWGFHQPCYGLVVHLICIEFILGMEKNRGKPAFFFLKLCSNMLGIQQNPVVQNIFFTHFPHETCDLGYPLD